MEQRIHELKQGRSPFFMTDPCYEQLLCDVVHKIKNGLGGIGGFAGLLDRDIDADDKRKRLVRRIQEGVLKVNDVVVALMILVRNTRPMCEQVPIRPMVKDVWENYWFEAGCDEDERGSTLEMDSEQSHVDTDPQLFQVLIYHTLRFIHLAGGKIDAIQWRDCDTQDFNMFFRFQNSIHSDSGPACLDRLACECEPLEARLSLAIVQKISNLLNGQVSINKIDHSNHEFLVEIQKGQIDL
jgi:hypothetical protein